MTLTNDRETMLQESMTAPAGLPGVSPAVVDTSPDYSDLTKLQFLYWISQTLRPDASLLNTIITFEIAERVDETLFSQAFQTVVDNSDAMRTVITEVDGEPRQLVQPQVTAVLDVVDLSTADDPYRAYEAWRQQRAVRDIPLTGPLFDSVLVKLAPAKYIWFLNMHHIIADASSFFLVYNYLIASYEALLAGNEPDAAQPQYQAYLDYESRYRQSRQYEKSAVFWQKKLADKPDPLRFFDKAPLKTTDRVCRISIDLGKERSDALRAAAHRKEVFRINEELSLFNLFAALYFAQLQSLTGNQQLGTVTTSHNRLIGKFKNTVGLFMEMFPLQISFADDETFASLIKKILHETRSTMPHAQYGSSISLPTEAFDTMFNMHPFPALYFGDKLVKVDRFHPGLGSESFSIHVYDYEESNHFVVNFDFHEELFDAAQRQAVIDHYLELVDAFLTDIHQPLQPQFVPPLTVAETAVSTNDRSPLAGERTIVAPRNKLEQTVAQIWEDVLDIRPVGVTESFFDLGGSSWLATRLLLKIQETTGHKLPLSALLEANTVAEMVALLEKGDDSLWSPLVQLKAGNPEKDAFYFVPGAGGSLIRLQGLVNRLDDDQPIYAFQFPGLDGKQPPISTISDMAAYMISVLREQQPHGPYLLAGYSWGGIVVYEIARRLEAQGEQIAMLVIIDTPAQDPRYGLIYRVTDPLSTLLRLKQPQREKLFLAVRDKLYRIEYLVRKTTQELAAVSLAGKLTYLRGKSKTAVSKLVQKLGRGKRPSPPKAVNPQQQFQNDFWDRFDLDALQAKLVRTNDRAIRLHILKPYYGDVTIFHSSQGYRNPLNRSAAPHLGWGNVVKGNLQSTPIPGDHLGMLQEPNVNVLAQKLQHCLDEAHARLQTNFIPKHMKNKATNARS